jgi:hypothetical protein
MSKCDDFRNDALKSLSEFYDPFIIQIQADITVVEAAGGDPHKQVMNGVVVDLYEKLNELKQQVESDAREVARQYEDCESRENWAPAQIATDLAIILATEGLSLIFPEKTFHVDVREIIRDGKLLGGDNALIPKARDQILNGLGIRGDAAKVIKDPVHTVRKWVKKIFPHW